MVQHLGGNATSPSKVLSRSDVLAKLVGHTIFVATTRENKAHWPMVMKGKIISFTSESVTFTNQYKNGAQTTVSLSDITYFSSLDSLDSIIELENIRPSDHNNQWASLLNMEVQCFNDMWLTCGTLTYIGENYVTIYEPEDGTYYYILMPTISSMKAVEPQE